MQTPHLHLPSSVQILKNLPSEGSDPLGRCWCRTSSRVGRVKPHGTGGRTQLTGWGWRMVDPAMLLPGRSSVDLRAALGRRPGMVPGHPSRSVMTRHLHTGQQPLIRACPRGLDTRLRRPASRRAVLLAVGVAGARGVAGRLVRPQAAARVHILLTSQPGSPLSLPSSFWVTPFGPALGHSSCLWGPWPRTIPPGGQPPAFLPSRPLSLPGLRDPRCPPGRGWILSPCRSAASGLAVRLPSALHPLPPCAPRRRPQRSGLSGGPPSSPSSGTSLTPTCLPPAWRPLALHARRVRSRGTAGDACCPCHGAAGPWAAWPHPPRPLRPASVLSSQGRKEL